MQTMNVKERRREHSQHSQSPYITKYREVSQYQVSVWVKVRSPGGRPAAVKFVKVPPDKYLLDRACCWCMEVAAQRLQSLVLFIFQPTLRERTIYRFLRV